MRGSRKRLKRRAAGRFGCERLETRAFLHGGSLSGSVYLDVDSDGTRDANELGVPGVVIRLSEANSTDTSAEKSTITDLDGAYRFEELLAATYQVAKRQSPATLNGPASSAAAAAATNNVLSVVLGDEEVRTENNFVEHGLRPEFIGIGWFFASSPPVPEMLRETIAVSEERAGNDELADSIRNGGQDVPDESNAAPVSVNDAYSVLENETLNVGGANGVLANDTDADGDALTAAIVAQPSNGTVTLNANGSFTYTPSTDFTGTDSFTYRASDAVVTSNVGTVTITINPDNGPQNEPFGPVTPGDFDDDDLLGTRTDQVPGAPEITAPHVTTGVDYTDYSNPPTYGPHHGVVRDPQSNFITPRPTGVYSTEQPDEDLIHNLEHGHVWISYHPTLLSDADQTKLEQLVADGGTNTGVILTPRARNTSAIALASWGRLQTLDSFDATAIRNFVETNRGHAPEGYIPSGQKPANGDQLNDNLPHTS